MATRPRALMIQGTGSDVGKSLLVAALARAFANRGLSVRPFKPQNMSNNAAVTADGGEIGRAQALQARAARVAPSVHMNPVLLKPQSDTGAQVVVQGRMLGTAEASEYQQRKGTLLTAVLDSFGRLGEGADLILVEGAGSPAEINLRARDIANMGFALAADVPVILAGDIDRGGVIASIVGTHTVLDHADRAAIKGFIINKFRGDVLLFDDGLIEIMRRTDWPSFGVLPFLSAAARLPAEDAVVLDHWRAGAGRALRIAVPMLSRIANFDDFDPLRLEPSVSVTMVPPGRPLPLDADLIILPGSKATIADLAFFRANGWDVDLHAHIRRGGRVLGICGGYQMLGRTIADPGGIEGPAGTQVQGLGWLEVDTVLTGIKVLKPVTGNGAAGEGTFAGYEMHVGVTTGRGRDRPMLWIDGAGPEGSVSADGHIAGCYVHGLFSSDAFRAGFLSGFGAASGLSYETAVDAALDECAAAVERHLDLDGLLAVAG